MIKFTAKSEKGQIVGLGIVRKNVERLMLGDPILVNLAELGIPGHVEVFVFYGETERDLLKEIKSRGLIGEDTHVHVGKIVTPPTQENP